MKKIIKIFDIILFILSISVLALIGSAEYILPSEVIFYDGCKNVSYFGIYSVCKEEKMVVSAYANEEGQEMAEVRVLNIFKAGEIRARDSKRKTVSLGGDLVGLRIYSEGLLVIGTDEIAYNGNFYSPAKAAGIEQGDRILEADGKKITSAEEFVKRVNTGEEIELKIKRDSNVFSVFLTPVYSENEGRYRCGLWVRDSSAGIGTLTFIDEDTKVFASLGHAVYDSETKSQVKIASGDLLNAEVTSIVKGEKGVTGQINGRFSGESVGKLYENNEFGVYGTITEEIKGDSQLYEIAAHSEVKKGPATIISTVSPEGKQEYDIEITEIGYSDASKSRALVIKITDSELLYKTGGIVQGMSGSPIIQNGKLVGAVTHVFLNDPTMGYGVFAETMLNESERIYNSYS